MWPVTSYLSALCFKGASNYQPPNKELAKQSGLFSRDLDTRHRCYHLTSTFGEDCQACTCASVLFVLPNGSMTMCTGHKWGCNINEPHLFPCSASAIPHVQELNDIPSILPPLEPAVKIFLSSSDDVKVTKLCYFKTSTLPCVGD